MVILIILGVSILLQLVAAVLALRLIAVTGKSRAWIFIAVAIFLMAVRRPITLYQTLPAELTQPVDLVEALVTLFISAFMLAGIAWIGPVFESVRASEKALRGSEEHFRSLFENTSIGFYRTTPDGHILLANPALVYMLGYETFEELARRNLEEEGFDQHSPRSEFRRRIESEGMVRDLESSWQKRDGTAIFVRESARVIRDEAGKILYYEGTIEDITERKKAEEEAKLSAELTDSLSRYANDFIILLDEKFRFLEVNERAVDFYGYTRDELIGMHASQLRSPDTKEKFLQQISQAQASGRAIYETIHRRKDGSEFPVEISLRAIQNNGKRFYQAIIRDITERKQAEQTIRSLARFPTENPNPVLRIARDGHLLYGNQAAFVLLKAWKLKVGQPAPEVLRNQAVEVLKRQKEITAEIPCGRRIFSITIAPAPEGEDVNLYARDVTKRAQAENKVRKLNAELEQRVLDRTAQLEVANKELEAFSYSVSHDLRAPLRALDGFSAGLLSKYSEKLDEQGRHYLERIREASQRMGQLIEDLLGLSRLSRSEFVRQPVDLSTLAEEIAAELRRRDPERQAEFVIAEKMVMEADPHLLRIVLQNLLDNAWKFTGTRPQARIEVGMKKQGKEKVCFVRDNGVGFDMTYVNKLFAPFQRLHAMEEFSGTGIGLATVQRIAARHGGRAWAEAAVDQGATFYFTMGGIHA